MADPADKEPAEGSRETVEKNLARQETEKQPNAGDKGMDQKGPAQPRRNG